MLELFYLNIFTPLLAGLLQTSQNKRIGAQSVAVQIKSNDLSIDLRVGLLSSNKRMLQS